MSAISEIAHAMSETTVRFSNVTFGFGDRVPLFENLSCDLSNDGTSGRIVALMGPSGAGKTTFCDLASGTRRPQKGDVTFGSGRANVAVIPQKGIIFDELSVRENIACLKYSNSLGSTFREDTVQAAAASLGLSQVLRDGTPASALSGGEAQRVMLARIQTVACDLLILDEPCSFLDNRVKGAFLDALRKTVDEHHLLALMVTHVWDEARLVADEVIFFNRQPGQSVTTHRSSTVDAEKRPPTIDALFGIHWPDCSALKVAEIPAGTTLSESLLPPTAAFVGVFQPPTEGSPVHVFYDANGIAVDSEA